MEVNIQGAERFFIASLEKPSLVCESECMNGHVDAGLLANPDPNMEQKMSDLSLPANQEVPEKVATFYEVARSCAIKVALGVPFAIGALAMISAGIEHWDRLGQIALAVWGMLLSIFSFGGNFWAAVSVSTFWISVLAWLSCVSASMPSEGQGRAMSYLGATALACGALWLVSYSAVLSSFAEFEALTVYQKTAVLFSAGPLLIFGLLSVFVFICAVADANQKS